MSQGRYPSDWDWRRKQVYQRDGYRCQQCGINGGTNGNAELHAHHRVSISKGGSHHFNNLVTVCKPCHEQIHGHRIPTGGTQTRKRRVSKPTSASSNTSTRNSHPDFSTEEARSLFYIFSAATIIWIIFGYFIDHFFNDSTISTSGIPEFELLVAGIWLIILSVLILFALAFDSEARE